MYDATMAVGRRPRTVRRRRSRPVEFDQVRIERAVADPGHRPGRGVRWPCV